MIAPELSARPRGQDDETPRSADGAADTAHTREEAHLAIAHRAESRGLAREATSSRSSTTSSHLAR
jgi:hypothetical protein